MNDIRELLRYKREMAEFEAWQRSTFKPVLSVLESVTRAHSVAFNYPQPRRLSEEIASTLAVYRRLLRDSLTVLQKELDEPALLYFVGEVADRHQRRVEEMWSISTDEFGCLMHGHSHAIGGDGTGEVPNATAESSVASEQAPPVASPNPTPVGNPASGANIDRKEGGRPKLGEGPNATPQEKALRNVYELIRREVQPGWGPARLFRHFRDNKDFTGRVKEAGKQFDEALFKAALAWIKENPDQETESGNVS